MMLNDIVVHLKSCHLSLPRGHEYEKPYTNQHSCKVYVYVVSVFVKVFLKLFFISAFLTNVNLEICKLF